MIKVIIKILIPAIIVLSVLSWGSKITLANHCAALKDLHGPHFSRGSIGLKVNENSKMTGEDCTNTLGPGQTNISNCISGTGYRYIVTYCTTTEDSKIFPNGNKVEFAGCEESYPEQSSEAPAQCNRPDPAAPSEIGKIFGQIDAPPGLSKFGFGAIGISSFLSNLVILIYTMAGIIFLLMILWGAFDWLTSGGEKEKIAAARTKIINAIIGVIIFALAFAIIQVIGVFTGFTFFAGQK